MKKLLTVLCTFSFAALVCAQQRVGGVGPAGTPGPVSVSISGGGDIIAGTGISIATNASHVWTITATGTNVAIINPDTTSIQTNGNGATLIIVNGSRQTNVNFYGSETFRSPSAIYGTAGKTIGIQTNIGPSIDSYDLGQSLPTMRLLSDQYGFRFLSQDGTTNFLTFGSYNSTGSADYQGGAGPLTEMLPRTFWSGYKRYGQYQLGSEAVGAAETSHSPLVGGNGSALTGLPSNGEMWQRLPRPSAILTTADLLGTTNFDSEYWITNAIRVYRSAGIIQALTNAGIMFYASIEEWMSDTRTVGGYLQVNNQFPKGLPWLSQYCHTNGMGLETHIDISATPSITKGGVFPATYLAITPISVHRDAEWFYTNGVDMIRLGDGTAGATQRDGVGDSQSAAGFGNQSLRIISDALLYPKGASLGLSTSVGYLSNNFGLGIALDSFLYTETQAAPPLPSAMYLVNNFQDDQGRSAGPNAGTDCGRAAYQLRLTWTNCAHLNGKGHYASQVYPSDGTFNISVNDARANWSAGAVTCGQPAFFSTNISATHTPVFTNAEMLAIYADTLGNGCFPVFDYGTNSAWAKKLSDGGWAVLIINESASTISENLLWSQLRTPPNYSPIGSISYPCVTPTNQFYAVRDIWGAADKGDYNNIYSQGLAAHTCLLLRLTPTMPFNSGFYANGTSPETYSLFLTGTVFSAKNDSAGIATYDRSVNNRFTEFYRLANVTYFYDNADGSNPIQMYPGGHVAFPQNMTNGACAGTGVRFVQADANGKFSAVTATNMSGLGDWNLDAGTGALTNTTGGANGVTVMQQLSVAGTNPGVITARITGSDGSGFLAGGTLSWAGSGALIFANMTKTARNALTPAAGWAVYQTDNTPGLRVYNGTHWVRYTETNDD